MLRLQSFVEFLWNYIVARVLFLMSFLGISSKYIGGVRLAYPTCGDFIASARPGTAGIRTGRAQDRRRRSQPYLVHATDDAAERFQSQVVYPPTFVFWNRRGRVLLEDGFVVTNTDAFIEEFSNYGGTRSHPSGLPRALRPALKFPPCERTDSLVVITKCAATNYFHWMTECLPRLRIAEESAIDLMATGPKILVPSASQVVKSTLRHLGYKDERWAIANSQTHLQAETLMVPSLPGEPGNPPPWVADYLRESFLELANVNRARSAPRIYVGRGRSGWRRVVNEPEVIAELGKYGFSAVIMDDLSFEEQITVFSHAEVIVAPHGAALTNLFWVKPGTRVLELFNPRHINPCYWCTADLVNAKYSCMICNDHIENQSKIYSFDMHVPLAKLSEAVRQVISS